MLAPAPGNALKLTRMSARWEAILRGDHPLSKAHRLGRGAFGLLPSPWRCRFCNAPFRGPGATVVRWVGYAPSRKNPNICARCIEAAPEGGAVVPITVLFADVRGYTSLSEHLEPRAVASLVNRFYRAASEALLSVGAVLGQVAGDEVNAFFVPGLAGRSYRAQALKGARRVLRGVGYGSPAGNWIGVGVGIASGEQFCGNVGGGGYKDFASVGDVTNTAARLTAAASGGQIIVDSTTFAAAGPSAATTRKQLMLKGKSAPVEAFVLEVSP